MKVARLVSAAVLGAALTVSVSAAADAASRTIDGSRTASVVVNPDQSRTKGHPVHADFRLGYKPVHSTLPGPFFRLS